MQLKVNPSKFNFIYLSKSKSFFPFLPHVMISDLTIYFSSTNRCLGFLLDSFLFINPQIFSVAFSCFFTYVISDRSLLISMMPLLRFLSALLFSLDLITATLCNLIFLNLLSTL